MYAASIVEQRLEFARTELGFYPEYHSPEDVDEFEHNLERRFRDDYAAARAEAAGSDDPAKTFQSRMLKALADPKNPRLTSEDVRFIENERALFQCDAAYALTRYCWVSNRENRIERFDFYGAQKILFGVIAELEAAGASIEILIAKARKLGMSTLVELLILIKAMTGEGVNAIVASADRMITTKMVKMLFLAYDRMPWWLRSITSRRVESDNGMIVFGGINAGIGFQHGKQTNPFAMGDTPVAYHLSEVSAYTNAHELIDIGLMKAVYPSTRVLGILESTCKGDTGWWSDSYWEAKEEWANHKSRLMALFLPFYTADQMYPSPTEARTHPVPENWKPENETRKMMAESCLYVQSNPVLSKVLSPNGKPYEMPRERAWYWEWNYLSARRHGTEKSWFQEMPHCLTGGTMVSTELGIMPIAKARACLMTESGPISRWIPQGEASIFRLTTKDGRLIEGTENHLIKTSNGWRELGKLVPGDAIELMPPRFSASPREHRWGWLPLCEMKVAMTPEVGRLLGYFMGDGSFHGGVFEVSVDEKDEDIRQEVTHLLLGASGRKPTEKKQGKMWRIQSSNQKWLEVLRSMDCVQPAIHKNLGRSCGWKRKVHVPACILESPREVVKEFLSALFECDGHAYVRAARIALFAKSDDFLRQVQLLLLGFGIRAKFEKKQIRHLDGHDYEGRSLVIPASFANAFYDLIGFRSKRKQFSGKRRSESRTWGVGTAALVDEVLSVAPTGRREEVFDLSIAETHQFSANGVLVHNCDVAAFQGSYDNVFGKEVIAEVFTQRDTRYEVYGIVGQSIEDRHEPAAEEVDYARPRLPVRYQSRRGETYRWEFVPLHWEEPFVELDEIRNFDSHMGKLFVWIPPQRGYRYSIGIDTSAGTGRDGTVIAVCRLGRNPQERDEQAAEWRSNLVGHVEAFAWGMAIAAYYGRYAGEADVRREPLVAVEQVAAVGDTVQLQMRQMGYTNFFKPIRYDNAGKYMKKINSHKEGWFTTGITRPILTNTFVTLVQNNWYKVNSPYTMWEMQHWEIHLTGRGVDKFEHSTNSTDDGIFANAMAAFCPRDLEPLAERTAKRFMGPVGEKGPKLDLTPTNGGTMISTTGYPVPRDKELRRLLR